MLRNEKNPGEGSASSSSSEMKPRTGGVCESICGVFWVLSGWANGCFH